METNFVSDGPDRNLGNTALSGVSIPITSVLGIGLLMLGFVVLVIEFYKSGDIALRSFMIDHLFAVVSTVSVIANIALLWKSRPFYFVDVFVVAVVLVDAYLSPVNSFRTALRNTQVGVGMGPQDPQQ